jgi:hypothetical protein
MTSLFCPFWLGGWIWYIPIYGDCVRFWLGITALAARNPFDAGFPGVQAVDGECTPYLACRPAWCPVEGDAKPSRFEVSA